MNLLKILRFNDLKPERGKPVSKNDLPIFQGTANASEVRMRQKKQSATCGGTVAPAQSAVPSALLLLPLPPHGLPHAAQSLCSAIHMFHELKRADTAFYLFHMLVEKCLKCSVPCRWHTVTSYYWSLFYLAVFDIYVFRDASETPDT